MENIPISAVVLISPAFRERGKNNNSEIASSVMGTAHTKNSVDQAIQGDRSKAQRKPFGLYNLLSAV